VTQTATARSAPPCSHRANVRRFRRVSTVRDARGRQGWRRATHAARAHVKPLQKVAHKGGDARDFD